MGRIYKKGARRSDDYLLAVGAGKIPDSSPVAMTGSAAALPTADDQYVVKENATDPEFWPNPAGETMVITSDNAADVGIAYRIEGLDEDFLEKTEFVVLNGTANITLSGLWTRVNAIRNVGPTAHVGQVTVVTTANANIVIAATADAQKSDQGQYTVPADKNAQILNVIATMTRTQGAVDAGVAVGMFFRFDVLGDVFTREFALALQRRGETIGEVQEPIPVAVSGPFDIKFVADASATNISVLTRATILLEDK